MALALSAVRTFVKLSQRWGAVLGKELCKPYFIKLVELIMADKAKGIQVYPREDQIFNALNLTDLDAVKGVIVGQDPYHGDGQAMGLSFSVPKGENVPPSLRNIHKELENDIPGFKIPDHGNLEKWADQGVLLLNRRLTVQADKANSHSNIGWERFTDEIIKQISENNKDVVFMLWGKDAHMMEQLIDTTKHTVLKDAHPSPLSVTKFKGCKCFSRANAALKKAGESEIDWTL